MTPDQIGFTWLLVAIPSMIFCIVQAIRHVTPAQHNMEITPRDTWIYKALGSVIWPLVLAVWIGIKFCKGFEWTIIRVFGIAEDIKTGLELMPEVIGSIPDTLLEKFNELEFQVKQKTCTHHYGHVVLDDERCCGNCHISLEYLWGNG
jgi:hypothetical protein